MNSKKKIIFILCSIRSGSTLLKNMLDQHPQIFAPAELHILPFDSLDDMELNLKGTMLATGLIEAIQKLKSCDETKAALIYEMFKTNNFSSHDVYSWFLSNIEETILVDKSPTYPLLESAMNRIQHLSAATYYIHLLRHPVTTIESITRNKFGKLSRMLNCNAIRIKNKYERTNQSYTSDFVFFKNPQLKNAKNPIALAEALWSVTNQNILAILEAVPSPKKFTLSYEELVNDPKKMMHQLCSFLDIAPNIAMCNPFPKKIYKETIGDPNFFKRDSIQNQNSFSLKNSFGENVSINKQTVDLALKFNYLCWEPKQGIPLLPAEQKFFDQNDYPNNHCLITTFEAPILTNFKAQKLARALKELMIENPTLSSTFVQKKGQWERKIVQSLDVKIHQLPCLSEENKTTIFEAYTKKWLDDLDIQSDPLFTIFYIYNNDNKQFTIRYIVHHLLMDGMAVIKFHEQLWNKTLNPTPEHLTFSAKNDLEHYSEKIKATTLIEDEPNFYKSRSCFKNRSLSESYESQEEFTSNIPKQSVHKGRLSYDEIACALYLSLQDDSDSQKSTIAHRFHHRNDFGENWKNLFAWLADDLPISLNCNQEKSSLLKQFKQNRKKAGKTANKFTVPATGKLLHEYCQIRLNYIPIFKKNNLASNTFNAPSSTLSFDKRNRRDYAIDFIVREHSDHFELIIRYSNKQLDHSFVADLVKKWNHHFNAFFPLSTVNK
jgi:hypothetical protein